MKKLPNIEISELVLVNPKNDWTRTFHGTIVRKTSDDGKPIVFGKVVVNEGKIWSSADSEHAVVNNLDEICKLKLDCGIHKRDGVSTVVADKLLFLN